MLLFFCFTMAAFTIAQASPFTTKSRSLQATTQTLPTFDADDLLSRTNDFVVVSLSNQNGLSDTGVSAQVQLMLDIISNYHLGRDSPRFETVHVSDNAAETVKTVQSLYDMGVRLFLGPETSNQAKALADWAESVDDPKPDVLFFSYWASNPDLGRRPSIVQTIPSDEELVSNMNSLRRLMKTREHISILHNDGVYNQGLRKIFQQLEPDRIRVTCEMTENSATLDFAEDCVRQVIQGSDPETTLVVILTSGRDTKLLLKAAYQVYSNERGYRTNNDKINWIGGDTIAFDGSTFDDADVDTAVWKGAQVVNLAGLVPSQGLLPTSNELAVKLWTDYAGLASFEGDDRTSTADVSPVVLLAADIASIIFLNAGTALTGKGIVASREQFRNVLLRQTPFLTSYGGDIKLSPKMQRVEMPYVVAKISQTQERPPMGYPIWKTQAFLNVNSQNDRSFIKLRSGSMIVPTRLVSLPPLPSRRDRALQFEKYDDPFSGDIDFVTKSDNMFNSYVGVRGSTIFDSSGPEIGKYVRRLEAGSVQTSDFFVRTTIGESVTAFWPTAVASNQCMRQLEHTIEMLDLVQFEGSIDLSVCTHAQTGFIMSLLGKPNGRTLEDFTDCDTNELLAAGLSAELTKEAGLDVALGNNSTLRMPYNCLTSQTVFASEVGRLAFTQKNFCGQTTGHSSMMEAYQMVHPSLFVTSGHAKPVLELPGLMRSYYETIVGKDDRLSVAKAQQAMETPLKLTSLDVFDKRYISHVRGEDWMCLCDEPGSRVTCSQMYRLIQCPIDASDLEADCCIPPAETVTCNTGVLSCGLAIMEHILHRDVFLQAKKKKIALHPRLSYEGVVPSTEGREGYESVAGIDFFIPICHQGNLMMNADLELMDPEERADDLTDEVGDIDDVDDENDESSSSSFNAFKMESSAWVMFAFWASMIVMSIM